MNDDVHMKFFPLEMTRADIEREGDAYVSLPDDWRDGDLTRAMALEMVDLMLAILDKTGARTLSDAKDVLRRVNAARQFGAN